MKSPVRGYKGRYRPRHPEKYTGNEDHIIFRSLAERKFMVFLDESEQCLKWGSEELSIPYVNELDGQVHKYFPDFYVEMLKEGEIKKYLIEIKPKFQTIPPKNTKSRYYLQECETYIINQCKWKAAELFCSEYGLEFKVMAV
jgi:hypothetical protein